MKHTAVSVFGDITGKGRKRQSTLSGSMAEETRGSTPTEKLAEHPKQDL